MQFDVYFAAPFTSLFEVKALANEDTLLLIMFLGLRKLGNICDGHKMFLNKIRNIFCVPDRKVLSATNVARAGKRGNICVGNNVSSFTRALKLCYMVSKVYFFFVLKQHFLFAG